MFSTREIDLERLAKPILYIDAKSTDEYQIFLEALENRKNVLPSF